MTEQPYNRLKESIYRGRLRPGQRIVERDLARRMGISRIPLRESLRRLESEGLVRSVPNTASFIEDFSPADIMEIFSMRQVLEPMAAGLAARRADASLIARLERLCEKMTRDTRNRNFAQLDLTDYRFHHAIVRASGHRRLLRAYENAHIRIIGPRTDFAHLLAQPADLTARDHLQLVECLRAHDAARAERIAREHIEPALAAVRQTLKDQNDQTGGSSAKEQA